MSQPQMMSSTLYTYTDSHIIQCVCVCVCLYIQCVCVFVPEDHFLIGRRPVRCEMREMGDLGVRWEHCRSSYAPSETLRKSKLTKQCLLKSVSYLE